MVFQKDEGGPVDEAEVEIGERLAAGDGVVASTGVGCVEVLPQLYVMC